MKSNRSLILFLFGISLLPKIYSDSFQPLFLVKKEGLYKFYHPSNSNEKIIPDKSNNPEAFYACPEKKGVYVLQVQNIKNAVRNDCENRVTPLTLTLLKKIESPDEIKLDVGFLIRDPDANASLSLKYEKWDETTDYTFIPFLNITMAASTSKWLISVFYRIKSGFLIDPESDASSSYAHEYNTNFDFYGFDIENLYAKENQRRIFSSISKDVYPANYNYDGQCLFKAQLAPSKDFLYDAWKSTSFTNVNTAPMWVQLRPQWGKIEKFVRKVATKTDLNVFAGASKILHLPDANKTPQPIYFNKEKTYPVSDYIWKLITDSKNKRAILIVMNNNPYIENQEKICADVSEKFGWKEVSNNDYKKGLTYVCAVNKNVMSKLNYDYDAQYEVFNLKALKNWNS